MNEPQNPPAASPEPTPPNNPTPPAPPPAATIVLNGQRTERETQLEAELESERRSHANTATEKKQRELRINELQDELHRLKTAQTDDPAKGKSFLDMSDFFED